LKRIFYRKNRFNASKCALLTHKNVVFFQNLSDWFGTHMGMNDRENRQEELSALVVAKFALKSS
jgi:hypothetical protein